MDKNINSFKSRFERWKNGESYWDIVGKPLPGQNKPEQLSDEQKAELDDYVRSITSYDKGKSRDGYYDYMEKLAANKAKEWKQDYDQTLLDMLNDNTYNYRAMYDKYGGDDTSHEGHFSDEFKTSYHPTFSNQSMYSGAKSQYNPTGVTGGSWSDNDSVYHIGDRWGSPGFNVFKTRDYLDMAEENPVLMRYRKGKSETKSQFVGDIYDRVYDALVSRNASTDLAPLMARQLSYESEYGTSNVASKYNNYGGVKQKGNSDVYARYKNRDDFVNSYVDLILNNYKTAAAARDVKTWARALKDGGYYEDTFDNYYGKMNNMKSFDKWLGRHLKSREYATGPKDRMLTIPTVQSTTPAKFEPVQIPQEDPRVLGPYKPIAQSYTPSVQIPDVSQIDQLAQYTPQYSTFNLGKSDIHIKKSKRGTFTAAANRAGMGVQAYANKVLSAPKGKYSSAMRKKANFARNAAEWN